MNENETPSAVAERPKPQLRVLERGIEIATTADLMRFAEMVAASELAPPAYRGKPANVFVAVEMGREIGLSPMHALQSIAVINGRPSVYGDALLAIIRSRDVVESHDERYEGTPFEDDFRAIVTTKRRGQAPHTQEFSVGDAKQAKLWRKAGPWTDYPKRMLLWRARSWAIRDVYGDVLAGLHVAEEAIDIPPSPVATVVETPARGVDALAERLNVA